MRGDIRFLQQLDFPSYAVELDWMMSDMNLIEDGFDLQSAVIVALGTNSLAPPDEELPDPDATDRCGWWGDVDAQELWEGWPVGCLLWLLRRAKITGPGAKQGSTLARADGWTRDAMRPFVEHRIASRIDVEAEKLDTSRIDVAVTIYRGPDRTIQLRYADLWDELGERLMPWITPTLKETRRLTRDYVLSQLGAKAMIPNSVLRIMSDSMAGLAHLTMLYLDWLAKQLMPDTAEAEWLDRHGYIWLVNADGSKGRKTATYAHGDIRYEGLPGIVIPVGTLLQGTNGVQYQTVSEAMIGADSLGSSSAVALTSGVMGNLPDGTSVSLVVPIPGILSATMYGDMDGGVDQETDDQLRERVLLRIQNPPMGGAQNDYVIWAFQMPGVTRAWAACEIGPGTMTVRFLMDDLHPDNYGLPTGADVEAVSDHINKMRPVTVKDCFVMAPILFFYDITISNLTVDDPTVRARIEASIKEMEYKRSKPGQTWYRSWVDEAISQAIGEETHELEFETVTMPAPAYMPVLGTVLYR